MHIRRDPATGDVMLSRRPEWWDDYFALDRTTEVPIDFMSEADRAQPEVGSDPLDEADGN